MKIISNFFNQKQFHKKLYESSNVEFAIVALYTLHEQYPNASINDILTEFDKQIEFNKLYNQCQKHVKDSITKLYEETIAPTNVSAGIDSSTPRISTKNKENKDAIRRTEKDKTQIQ